MPEKNGNVLRPASEKQLDELRICIEKALNQMRGRIPDKVAQRWIGDNKALSVSLEQLLLPPEPEAKTDFCQLYPDQEIVLGPTDGTRTIGKAKDVFGFLDDNFAKWSLDIAPIPTQATKVALWEMTKNGSFQNVYTSFGRPLEALCLTQHQIIDLCVEHRDRLRLCGQGTFFLFQIRGKFFLADIRTDSSRCLFAYVRFFSSEIVLNALSGHRFVLPKLED